jgi:hypothetical protein
VEEIRFVPGAACDQTTIVGHRNLFLVRQVDAETFLLEDPVVGC